MGGKNLPKKSKGSQKEMNLHGKDIKIFTANSNPKVAAEIAAGFASRKKRGKNIL